MTREKEAYVAFGLAASLTGHTESLGLSDVGVLLSLCEAGYRVQGLPSVMNTEPPHFCMLYLHPKLGYVKVQVDVVPTSLVLRDWPLHAN